MTIAAVVPDIAFAGSSSPGTMGPFSLVKNGTPLVFFNNSEVVVLRYDSVTDTTPTLLVEGTDYDLTGGPTAGSLTLTAPQTGLLTGERLYVTTLSALAQSLDLVNGGNFSSANLERRLDIIFQILQQHDREIKSTMRFAMFDTDEIPKTTPLGAVIDKIPYVTGTASAPTVAYLDALVLNDLAELGTENFANIAIVAADLAGADTIGIVAAAATDIETVADNMAEVLAVAGALDQNGNVIGLVGPEGPPGPQGPEGPQGPQGAAGDGTGDMLKSENLSGLANYTTARSNLGLGTAAVKNTGTSGDAVPLLNAANTWSGTQTLSGAGLKWATTSTTSSDPGFHMTNSSARLDRILNTSSGLYIGVDATGTERTLTLSTAGVLATGGNTVWHAGNDGAGSGLDADTLDGVQGSGFAQLSLASLQTFTDPIAIGNTGGGATLSLARTGQAATFTFTMSGGNANLNNASTNLNLQVGGVTYLAITSSLVTASAPLVARVAASATTTGTLTAASANRTIQATGNITINNSVFSAGDIILIYAGDTSRTITQGSGVTMRLGGTATTGSRTLAARGVAVLFFVSASEVVVSGGAVT